MKKCFEKITFHSALAWPEGELLLQIMIFDQSYLTQAWSELSWRSVLPSSPTPYYLEIIQEDNKVCGLILFSLSPYENLAHLLKIIIHPHYRQQGLAISLLQAAEDYFLIPPQVYTTIFLEVAELNKSAINLYQKWGFGPIHLAKHFYGPHQHAIKMKKILPQIKDIQENNRQE